jgi:hypothetical protein
MPSGNKSIKTTATINPIASPIARIGTLDAAPTRISDLQDRGGNAVDRHRRPAIYLLYANLRSQGQFERCPCYF